ncbi:MAG: methyltransferase [Meiothermus sp.]|uniref:methyltransferase n=1 Tax=Thermaceae TaxID=188786 RepID=UPI0025D8E21F|nr:MULTISPECIES: methyltransferase [Thermaceae]MCS7059082.1 methyltransferase [Meiothermus sp.]MCS7195546.1 methyltransferase [Meiothermus sp.]MCX7850315.1 methyltransferase [Thermus sp.]MDW8090474.1 methyltransferase [Meiothermus sp.]MDW8481025.1 methyltransferase [Meiothermus sp.]
MTLEAYHALRPFSAPEGHLFVKAGARGLDDPAYELLAQSLEPYGEEALDLNPGVGRVTLALLQHGLLVRAIETSRAALRCLEAGLAKRAEIVCGLPWEAPSESADMVALVLPAERGTRYVTLSLLGAARALRMGGRFYIAGNKSRGFDHYFRLAQEILGFGVVLERKGPLRVAVLEKEKPPPPLPPAWASFSCWVRGRTLEFAYLPGVFSAGGLDPGSTLLLENLEGDLGQVLDLGAGYGALSLPLVGWAEGLVLLEDDWPSVLSARRNLGEKATVLHSDVDEALTKGRTFATIVANPPFHVGGLVVLETAVAFIEAAYARLERGGKFYLVANRFLPYEPLLLERFGRVRTLAENSHKVLLAQKLG